MKNYDFNQVVLLPILDLILKQGINEFKQNILNIDFEEDGMSTSYSDDFCLIDMFIDSLFGTSISSYIVNLFYDNSISSFSILTYYNQNIDTLKNKQIDELCDTYFELFQNLYYFLKELKSDDIFSFYIDDDSRLCFKKC